jgi:hypothetical protein
VGFEIISLPLETEIALAGIDGTMQRADYPLEHQQMFVPFQANYLEAHMKLTVRFFPCRRLKTLLQPLQLMFIIGPTFYIA